MVVFVHSPSFDKRTYTWTMRLLKTKTWSGATYNKQRAPPSRMHTHQADRSDSEREQKRRNVMLRQRSPVKKHATWLTCRSFFSLLLNVHAWLKRFEIAHVIMHSEMCPALQFAITCKEAVVNNLLFNRLIRCGFYFSFHLFFSFTFFVCLIFY